MSKYRGRQSHRSRMDIITSILEFIDQKGTALKTHILYSANLNSKSLDKFLNQLIDAGLIGVSSENGSDYYYITARGRRFLMYTNYMTSILGRGKEKMSIIDACYKLGLREEKYKIKEGVVARGTSGIPYVLPLALVDFRERPEKVKAVIEVIGPETTIKEAVNLTAWMWFTAMDLGLPLILVVPEQHVTTIQKILEPVRERNLPEPRIIAYNKYESPEIIGKRMIEVALSISNT